MNLKNLHLDTKPAQTNVLFAGAEGKVISIQIASPEQLKEHLSKVPELLIYVSGNAIYKKEKPHDY